MRSFGETAPRIGMAAFPPPATSMRQAVTRLFVERSCLGWPRWPSSSILARSSRGGRTENLEAHQGVVSTACQRSLDLRAEAGHWGKRSPKPACNRASCVISPQGRPWPPASGSDAGWNTKDSRKTATTRTHRVKMSRNSSNWRESRTTPMAKKSALFLEIFPSMAYAQCGCRWCPGHNKGRARCRVGVGAYAWLVEQWEVVCTGALWSVEVHRGCRGASHQGRGDEKTVI